jgi:ribosomal-protein-alanine N-acetyltransferase
VPDLATATGAQVERLTPLLATSGLLDGPADYLALWEREPWRVRVGPGDEIALVRDHSYRPYLLIEGLWCTEDRVPALVSDLAALAVGRGRERVVSPFVDAPRAAAYRLAGMTPSHEVVAMRLERPKADAPAPAIVAARGSLADAAEMLALEAEVFEPFWRLDEEWLARIVPSGWVGTVRQGGRLAGYVVARPQGRQGHIARLAVHPAHRRAGVGGALLDEALRRLAAHGARSVTVNTQGDNDAARSLYRSRGFGEDAEPLLVLMSDRLERREGSDEEG